MYPLSIYTFCLTVITVQICFFRPLFIQYLFHIKDSLLCRLQHNIQMPNDRLYSSICILYSILRIKPRSFYVFGSLFQCFGIFARSFFSQSFCLVRRRMASSWAWTVSSWAWMILSRFSICMSHHTCIVPTAYI